MSKFVDLFSSKRKKVKSENLRQTILNQVHDKGELMNAFPYIMRNVHVLVSVGFVDNNIGMIFWDVNCGYDFIEKIDSVHKYWVTCIVELPNNYLATGSHDESIKIWDLQSGENTFTLKEEKSHNKCVNCMVSFGDDRLIAGLNDNSIRMWNYKESKQIGLYLSHNWTVSGMVWVDQIMGRLASCSWDKSVKLWDIPKKKVMTTWKEHESVVNSIDYHDDMGIIATAGADKLVKLWDYHQRKCVQTFEGNAPFCKVRIIPKRNLLLAGGDLGKIKVYDIRQNKEELEAFNAHSDKILDIELLPKDRIATSSTESKIKIWNDDFSFHKEISGHSRIVSSLKFLSAKTTVRMNNTSKPIPLNKFQTDIKNASKSLSSSVNRDSKNKRIPTKKPSEIKAPVTTGEEIIGGTTGDTNLDKPGENIEIPMKETPRVVKDLNDNRDEILKI